MKDRCVYTHSDGVGAQGSAPSLLYLPVYPSPALVTGALGLPEPQLETSAQDKAARGCSIQFVNRLPFGEVYSGTPLSFWWWWFLLLQKQMCSMIHLKKKRTTDRKRVFVPPECHADRGLHGP